MSQKGTILPTKLVTSHHHPPIRIRRKTFYCPWKRINNKLHHFSYNFLKKKLCKSWSSKFNTWNFPKKCFVILRSRIQWRISFVHLDQLNIKLKTWFKKCFFILRSRFQERLDWSTKYKTWNLLKNVFSIFIPDFKELQKLIREINPDTELLTHRLEAKLWRSKFC